MIKKINRLEDIIIGKLLVVVTLIVFAEVIARFVFNTGIHWAQEATLLLSAWMVLLGCAWAVREKSHICVDALLDRLPQGVRRYVVLFSVVVALIYSGMFGYSSWIYVSKLKMIGIPLEDIDIPKWVAVSGLLAGFAMLAIRLLELAWEVWKGDADSFHKHREVDFDENELNNGKGGDA
ncbi:MAG: C4-dicarboxylate ABC transporter permease [Oceanospirillaceae bacterium]|nr:C4-dicarboxylate ABC transporter permease [Oceanospirillaceae bacterium]MBT13105.1 C4-dicarboxylate ABC transporter permease [Oceanospirillaceae bacterium]|tara:strand:+ start:18427 stop:18963 length:537 start_codon:yes stop_codon:yes gene_type:complete